MAAETKRERVARWVASITVPYRAKRWSDALAAIRAVRAEVPGSDDYLGHMAAQIIQQERAATVRSPF